MAVPLVPGPGLGNANTARKPTGALPESQCDFCSVLIEPKHSRTMREWADTRHPAARHATQSPRSRACLDPCLARGTRPARTPCSGHAALAGPYPGGTRASPGPWPPVTWSARGRGTERAYYSGTRTSGRRPCTPAVPSCAPPPTRRSRRPRSPCPRDGPRRHENIPQDLRHASASRCPGRL